MPNYTLYYFNGRGRAEILRMMFAAAGVPFVDKRFEFSEWDRYRNDMPGMCLPCLEMDGGYRMPETMAICRYLAREFGFYGRSTTDMFTIDYICDCFYEIMHDYLRYYHWKNGRFIYNLNNYGFGKETKTSTYNSYMYWRYMNTCKRILPFLERTLSLRKGGSHYFMGEQMMWCDMMCYCCLEGPYMENASMFTKFPKMMALWRRVATHPKICGYLKARCSSMW